MTNRDSTAKPPLSYPVIRPESDGDARGIRPVIVAAFGRELEADLVEALRNHGALVASFVARAGGEIVGHVAFSPMHADGQPDRNDVLGLAPVAVHPKGQRRGVGSALIRRGLEECRRRAVAAVFVLGEPTFYARFGFVPARARGLRCVYHAPPDAFQVLLLGDALAIPTTGLIRYRPEFDSLS
jgi:putative acetyltransferase